MPETGRAEKEGDSSSRSAPSTLRQSSHGASTKSDEIEQQDFANPTLNIINRVTRSASTSGISSPSREGTPPPLPPRPRILTSRPSTSHSIRKSPSRPQLISKATTQLSLSTSLSTDASGFPFPKARDQLSIPSVHGQSINPNANANPPSHSASDVDDTESLAPAVAIGDAESILGEMIGTVPEAKSQTEQVLLRKLGHKFQDAEAQSIFPPDPWFDAAFSCEFDDIKEMKTDGSNEGELHALYIAACADVAIESVMREWRAKLKHFLILSSAGKPIYSRHGDDQLISNYIGVVQTIISFYQSTNDSLRGFTAGDVRFVVMSKGPLNLVAITRLPESDSQLRTQLEALYMQILSTLTLPSMQRMFAARANYDLRRPLQGTETLLSALVDGFTRGSPSTLLSALECLKLRKSQRDTINNTLLKTRSDNLLYGLIVASGKLVSVVRPKKHSLHPGDLQLIFNMLFEAGSVKAGGGENWIPLCLPGFNNTGYLYMYVSFLNLEHPTEQMQERPHTRDGSDDEVAVLLISAEKESFFELRRMRDELVEVRNSIFFTHSKVSLFQH